MKKHFSLLLNLLLSSTLFWGVPEAGDDLAARTSAVVARHREAARRAKDVARAEANDPECTAAKRVSGEGSGD